MENDRTNSEFRQHSLPFSNPPKKEKSKTFPTGKGKSHQLSRPRYGGRAGDSPSGVVTPDERDLKDAQQGKAGHEETTENELFLPCLYSNNSNGRYHKSTELKVVSALARFLSPYHRRQAEALHLNVERLIGSAPDIGHVAFFTLTTKDNVANHEEFQRRWNSFRTGFLSKSAHFGSWIGTYERQGAKAKHAWHIHLVVVVSQDIRTGCDFSEFEKRRYKSAPPYLRGLWAELREKCESYGFGRHELLPVKSTAEGLARYVGKYVSKHIGARQEEDKGKRLIVASRDWVRHSCNFAWNNEGGQEWRRKLKIFANLIGCHSIEQLSSRLGPGWAYRYADSIMDADDMLKRCKDHFEQKKADGRSRTMDPDRGTSAYPALVQICTESIKKPALCAESIEKPVLCAQCIKTATRSTDGGLGVEQGESTVTPVRAYRPVDNQDNKAAATDLGIAVSAVESDHFPFQGAVKASFQRGKDESSDSATDLPPNLAEYHRTQQGVANQFKNNHQRLPAPPFVPEKT